MPYGITFLSLRSVSLELHSKTFIMSALSFNQILKYDEHIRLLQNLHLVHEDA